MTDNLDVIILDDDAGVCIGSAGDIVNMCLVAGIDSLLEKPIRPFVLEPAVRAIVSKYLHVTGKLSLNPDFAESVRKFTD
ncbi:MAG: hypothetical protein CVU61_11805 [Deltaproteobacteria bacterium HGW-Deltaproteobacteria-19]|jgi:hypothetical protein|nr:MAG: hypothetical protein CVU61_11805 [Deltaproteobacteria bacterium HGW-Deltaproteobacteria-19]